MFAQCITAMAHHQYLELEGGHKLVEFIVKQCALSDEEVGCVLCFDVHFTCQKLCGNVQPFNGYQHSYVYMHSLLVSGVACETEQHV